MPFKYYTIGFNPSDGSSVQVQLDQVELLLLLGDSSVFQTRVVKYFFQNFIK